MINVSTLVEKLRTDQRVYEKIFEQRLRTLAEAKKYLVPFPVGREGEALLVRETLGNLTQPGRKGTTNFVSSFADLKQRIGKPKPIKVDLKLTEIELATLQRNYIARREPSDPRDIYDVAGRSYLMGRIYRKIEDEVSRAFYKGVNADTGVQGGLNLFNGFEALFLQGYLTQANGGIGDIPVENKVPSPAIAITQANVIAELKKMRDVILNSPYTKEFADEQGTVYVDWNIIVMLNDALEASDTNRDQVVSKGADGTYAFNSLPNVKIVAPKFMWGTGNMFYSIEGNLFYLYEDEFEMQGPAIQFEKTGRDLNIFIDGSASVDYADGRLIILYK